MEEADLLHFERLKSSGKIEKSIAEIRQFVTAGTCYAGWSGGKDSMVVSHLIAMANVAIPVWWIKAQPFANPENERMITATQWLEVRVKKITYTRIVWDGQDNPEGDRQFFAAFREFGHRHISGVRADESGVRKIRMRRWGLSTGSTCCPIGWWTAQDVFAYLAGCHLPVHPNYAMLGSGRWLRDELRVDELGGQGGNQYGRAEWENEYYGDVLREIRTKVLATTQNS